MQRKADISVSHLAKIETHARLMGMKTYIRLLEAMDIPIKRTLHTHGDSKKRYDVEGEDLVSGTGL